VCVCVCACVCLWGCISPTNSQTLDASTLPHLARSTRAVSMMGSASTVKPRSRRRSACEATSRATGPGTRVSASCRSPCARHCLQAPSAGRQAPANACTVGTRHAAISTSIPLAIRGRQREFARSLLHPKAKGMLAQPPALAPLAFSGAPPLSGYACCMLHLCPSLLYAASLHSLPPLCLAVVHVLQLYSAA